LRAVGERDHRLAAVKGHYQVGRGGNAGDEHGDVVEDALLRLELQGHAVERQGGRHHNDEADGEGGVHHRARENGPIGGERGRSSASSEGEGLALAKAPVRRLASGCSRRPGATIVSSP